MNRAIAWLLLEFIGLGLGTTATVVYVTHRGERLGEISGIVYVSDTPGFSDVIINNQVLCEGDIIYGVKVIKISRDTVEFQRDGNTWKQRLREHPNPAWKNSDKPAQ